MTSYMHWDELDWLSSARSIVEWIRQRPSGQNPMIFLRHSHRDEITDHSLQFSTGLTEIGELMSYEMGKRLPASKPIRIFFSFVPRCHKTAEALAKGLRENGGEILEFEPIPVLVMPEYSDETVWENLQPDGKNVTEFVNRWADGEFGERIESFENYRARLIEATIGKLAKENDPVMHLHVSHDLALMAIKRILLERPIGNQDREPFQGGICVAVDKNRMWHFYNSGEESSIAPTIDSTESES